MTWDTDLDEDRNEFLRERPERILRCLSCGHGFFESDGRCDTCDDGNAQEAEERDAVA